MAASNGAGGADGDGIRVLHVDDDGQFRELTAEVLERESDHIEVVSEPSARDGLERLATDRVDCVVSDYEMPRTDGIAFLDAVRDDHPDLPFVLFTGKGSEEVASDAISAGATDYIQKEQGIDQFTVLANRVENTVERARAESQRDRRLAAIETAQEGISILDADGHFVYVNEAYADLYGYAPEEMVGRHWELVYPPAETDFAREEVLPTVESEGHWHGRTTGLRADGSTFPEDHVVAAAESGELVCTVRDLSDRKEREQQLVGFRTLVETIDDPVYLLDEAGRFEYVNQAFLELVGYDREEMLGAGPGRIKEEAAIEKAEENLGRVLSDSGPDSARFEVTIRPKNNDPVVCEDHIAVLPYEGDEFDGSVGILRVVDGERNR